MKRAFTLRRIRFWSAATGRRFPTGRQVSQFQSADLSAQSKSGPCLTPWTLDVRSRFIGVGLCACVFILVVSPAFALTENPYHSIVGRNAFALKPPTLPPVLTPPPAAPANVELRGITTLLGRPQVLLNFKIPAKPPEPPKDRSLVMDVGQREGDVEVLEINPATGAVRIRNQGNELAMNLKDNAAKPQAVPSLAPALGLPAVPQPYVNPGLSAAGGVPAPAGSGATLPTRQMRSDNPSGAAPTLSEQPSSSRIEANVALYEANRAKNEELIKAGVKLPRMPVHSLLKRDPQATQP